MRGPRGPRRRPSRRRCRQGRRRGRPVWVLKRKEEVEREGAVERKKMRSKSLPLLLVAVDVSTQTIASDHQLLITYLHVVAAEAERVAPGE